MIILKRFIKKIKKIYLYRINYFLGVKMIESPEQIAIENEIKIQKDKFLSYFNGSLPDTMELEFEGFYRRGFFVSKQRYAVIEDGKIILRKKTFRHRSLEERAAAYGGKLGPYTEYDWGEPEGREVL